MPVRISANPDSDGIIRMTLGNDVIEIKIEGADDGEEDGSGLGATSWKLPERSPAREGFLGILPVKSAKLKVGDIPDTFVNAPRAANGEVDDQQLLDMIERQISDQGRPDPAAVVVSVQESDLPALARLRNRLVGAGQSLPIMIVLEGSGS